MAFGKKTLCILKIPKNILAGYRFGQTIPDDAVADKLALQSMQANTHFSMQPSGDVVLFFITSPVILGKPIMGETRLQQSRTSIFLDPTAAALEQEHCEIYPFKTNHSSFDDANFSLLNMSTNGTFAHVGDAVFSLPKNRYTLLKCEDAVILDRQQTMKFTVTKSNQHHS